MKRRTHPFGKKHPGGHGSEVQREPKRPPGPVKPIISTQKHGKMTTFHDTDEHPISDGCAGIIALIIAVILMFPRCGNSQNPDIEFRSLFQIRYALPDTVQIQHVGYNIRLSQSGVECVPLNPATGAMPAIPVQSWIQGDSGEWIGITKSGGTVTLWACCGADMMLEINAGRQVVDFYNMAPVLLTWKERTKL